VGKKHIPAPSVDHVSNIVATVAEASPEELAYGKNWYPAYRASIARVALKAGLTDAQGCALFAVLSQQTRIEDNWRNYRAVAYSHDAYAAHTTALGSMKTKCAAILLDAIDPGRHAKGEKISSFYRNLMGCEESVTVDRHAISCCFNEMINRVGPHYLYVQDCFRMAAALLDMTPAQCQAVAWVVWRRMKGIVDAEVTA
jgi:hypothetical protein